MKTILVAYDDTEPSRRALERAATLAQAVSRRVGCDLLIVHPGG